MYKNSDSFFAKTITQMSSKYGSIVGLRLFQKKFICVSGYEAVTEALNNPALDSRPNSFDFNCRTSGLRRGIYFWPFWPFWPLWPFWPARRGARAAAPPASTPPAGPPTEARPGALRAGPGRPGRPTGWTRPALRGKRRRFVRETAPFRARQGGGRPESQSLQPQASLPVVAARRRETGSG